MKTHSVKVTLEDNSTYTADVTGPFADVGAVEKHIKAHNPKVKSVEAVVAEAKAD